MNGSVLPLVAALALGCSFPLPLDGQTRAALVLGLPASTEAMSLGDVFPVSGRDADAVFYNPAALTAARGVGVAGQRIGSGTAMFGASGALPWLGGGVGIGVQALSYDVGENGRPVEADVVSGGSVAVAELVATIGYGREWGPVRLGAAGKMVEQRIGTRRGATGAVDLGATADVAFMTLGLAVQNLGPDLRLGNEDMGLPDRVTLSGAFEPEPVGPFDMRAVAAVARRTDGEIIPAGGVDIRFWPIQGRTFIGRVGVRRVADGPARPVTFGLAFWGDGFAVEYAFQGYDGADAHRVGVRWRQ